MVVVSYLFENALSCNTHIQAFISVFLWPPRFVSLFSLYVSFGFCTSCFRLSSVSDLGSQLTLNSGTRKSWDYKLRVGEGALQLLCYDLAGLFNLQFSLFRAFFFLTWQGVCFHLLAWKQKKKKKSCCQSLLFFPCFTAPHSCFCNSFLCLSRLFQVILFNIVSLFWPQFASFPLLKTCSKSKTSRSFSFH